MILLVVDGGRSSILSHNYSQSNPFHLVVSIKYNTDLSIYFTYENEFFKNEKQNNFFKKWNTPFLHEKRLFYKNENVFFTTKTTFKNEKKNYTLNSYFYK